MPGGAVCVQWLRGTQKAEGVGKCTLFSYGLNAESAS